MKTSYRFAALSPFISAVVAFATVAAMIPGSEINSGKQPCAKIWDVVDQHHEGFASDVKATQLLECG